MKQRAGWIRMALFAFSTVIVTAHAQEKAPPKTDGPQDCIACHQSGGNFVRNFKMWQESGHSRALSLISQNTQASADCFSCHSDEGFKAKRLGKKVDIAQKDSFNTVACVTCHHLPHDSKYPRQLVDDPETLCTSCHTQRLVLQGRGAKGMEDDARSFHSAVDCISCHMSETNHRMKVIRPDDPDVSDKRMDTCTACHKDNNRKARIVQLRDWQQSYKERMDPLQADLSALNAALKANPSLLNGEAKIKLNNVNYNLSLLVKDGSRGSHNIDLTTEIFTMAARDLKEIKAAAGLAKGK